MRDEKFPMGKIPDRRTGIIYKENIGNLKNNGAGYRKEKDPRRVLNHDFPIPELGKVAPYGVYVLNDNTGFINLGVCHDTS